MSETAAVKKSSAIAWMVLIGVLVVIAGLATRNYASAMMAEALRLAPLRNPDLPPIPGLEVTGPTIESAISVGYVGLGLIVFGAALFLAGLSVVALHRERRKSPERQQTPRG
jgi:hypothetical protein